MRRLKADFQLAIVTLTAICGVLGITPFAVYRLARGDWLLGCVEAAIVLSISGSVVYAWRTGRADLAAWFDAMLATAGCVVVIGLLGESGLRWLYVVVIVNFLLVPPRAAALANILAVGALMFYPDVYRSSWDQLTYLATIAMVSIAACVFSLRAQQHRAELERLANCDPLTGVMNRRAMERELEIAVAQARRDSRPVAVAVLDLDHFKEVNDRFGHGAGDQVLVDVVDAIRQSTRRTDRIFRYGGEEFVVILGGVAEDALSSLLDAIRNEIRHRVRVNGETVTASIGAASLLPNDDWHAWLRRADAALYDAKRDGRDTVMIWGSAPSAGN